MSGGAAPAVQVACGAIASESLTSGQHHRGSDLTMVDLIGISMDRHGASYVFL